MFTFHSLAVARNSDIEDLEVPITPSKDRGTNSDSDSENDDDDRHDDDGDWNRAE